MPRAAASDRARREVIATIAGHPEGLQRSARIVPGSEKGMPLPLQVLQVEETYPSAAAFSSSSDGTASTSGRPWMQSKYIRNICVYI